MFGRNPLAQLSHWLVQPASHVLSSARPSGLGYKKYKLTKIGGSGLFDIRARPDDLTGGETSPRRIATPHDLARTTHGRPNDQAQKAHGKPAAPTNGAAGQAGCGQTPEAEAQINYKNYK